MTGIAVHCVRCMAATVLVLCMTTSCEDDDPTYHENGGIVVLGCEEGSLEPVAGLSDDILGDDVVQALALYDVLSGAWSVSVECDTADHSTFAVTLDIPARQDLYVVRGPPEDIPANGYFTCKQNTILALESGTVRIQDPNGSPLFETPRSVAVLVDGSDEEGTVVRVRGAWDLTGVDHVQAVLLIGVDVMGAILGQLSLVGSDSIAFNDGTVLERRWVLDTCELSDWVMAQGP